MKPLGQHCVNVRLFNTSITGLTWTKHEVNPCSPSGALRLENGGIKRGLDNVTSVGLRTGHLICHPSITMQQV